jgi:signal transduction histidine kinase
MESDREDLRRRLMSVQENERLRLSHELHDETGQILAAALLELKMIESMSTPEAIARINTLQKRLEGMGQSLHRIAWELRPASLGELGLADAVQNYAASWSRQYGIETDVHCEGDLAHLESEVSTAVYRVLQEALTNVAKHAKSATVVSIILDHTDGQLRLTIEDDGEGFEASDHTTGGPSGGIGLAGVRERVALIGGTVEIESSVHSGTGIFARIPVARAA